MKQRIIHSYKNVHPIMDQIERLYTSISLDEPDPSSLFGVSPYDESFKPLFDILLDNVYFVKKPVLSNCKLGSLSLNNIDEKTIVVAVSGGKDSLATVYHYLNLGYKVYLYHMKGINKAYSDEYTAVEYLAQELDLPLYVDDITLSGYHTYIEHPMKNMIIANGALYHAIANCNTANIAFGNYTDSYLEDNPFMVCAGDCIEMWRAYENIISKFIPQFNLGLPLRNISDAYSIMSRHIDMLPNTISCMSPYRFRASWRERTMKKYPIELWPNRCGSCWKCAYEYIYLVDHNYISVQKEYYLHCIVVLSNTLKKETGECTGYAIDVFKHYFSYNIEQSKCKEEILDGIIRAGKVISAKNSVRG